MKNNYIQLFIVLLIIAITSCTKDTIIPALVDTNIVKPPPPTVGNNVLYINEFMAKNSLISCPDSGNGNYKDADWLEIFNPNDVAIDLGGYYLTDSFPDKTKFQIPTGNISSTTIPAHGFLLFWCDGRTPLGIKHTTFSLSKSGEHIGLVKPDGLTFIDSLTFGAQTSDVSWGRALDGSSSWKAFSPATPGSSNN